MTGPGEGPPAPARPGRPAASGQPFSKGSISLGLYAQALPAVAAVEQLVTQAEVAANAGFDGVSVSEHHAGFNGYLPDPVLVASWLLDAMPRGWGAACPVLLPLRPVGLLIESVAWSAARYPGRFGVAFAPGWAPDDFAIAGAPYEDRRDRYRHGLEQVCAALRRGVTEGPLRHDAAVQACISDPVTVLAAAAGPVGARRCAHAGAGIILGDSHSTERLRELFTAYLAAGGDGPRVAIKRVWLGEPPHEAIEQLLRSYTAAPGERSSSIVVVGHQPDELAQQLAAIADESGATALSLRVHLPTIASEAELEQIQKVGEDVLPLLRRYIAEFSD